MNVPLAWKVIGVLVAVPLLALGLVQTASAFGHAEHNETTRLPAAGVRRLDVHNNAGKVRVVGVSDTDEVVVSAHISDGIRATGHRVTQVGDRIEITGSCPVIGSTWCHYNVSIEVPRDVTVEVHAEEDVDISDLTGDVVASADAASVTLTNVSGDVRASSDQGRVTGRDLTVSRIEAHADQGRIELSFDESPMAIDADADQGSVEIRLPDDENVAFAVDSKADQGTETVAIRTDPTSDRTLRARADQGDITITYRG
jgi:DUF4097 and DUF4098 domain-containing protein YvlB